MQHCVKDILPKASYTEYDIIIIVHHIRRSCARAWPYKSALMAKIGNSQNSEVYVIVVDTETQWNLAGLHKFN